MATPVKVAPGLLVRPLRWLMRVSCGGGGRERKRGPTAVASVWGWRRRTGAAPSSGPGQGITGMNHIVLLGDSVFDNAAYVAGSPDVVRQLREIVPPGWRATLQARDGAV